MKQFSIVLLLTGMFLAETSFAQNSCFTSLSDYSFTGISTVRCAVTGDFNGDSNLDLVMGTYTTATSNQMAIFLGTGNGSFGAATLFTGCQRPQDVKAYDFNGDTYLDLAIVSNNTSRVVVCLGNGAGGFAAPVNYILGVTTGPNGVDFGDFDGDGNMDMVVSYQSSTQGFYFLSGNGDGTFDAGVSYTMGASPRDVVVGDFNEDLKLDVVTTNNSAGSVSIRFGNGDGTFTAKTDYATVGSPVYIKAGDINGDLHTDLVVSSSTANMVSLLMGTGTGTFAAADNYAVSGSPFEIILEDYNENGDLDVGVVGNSDNTINILLGTGVDVAASRLSSVNKFPVFGSPHTMINGDYNEDSHTDLAVPAQAGTARFLVMLGTGTGSFNTGANIGTGDGPNSIAYGEYNSNANSDLITANKTANTVSFFSGNGNGTYATGLEFATGTGPVSVYTTDVNHDGFSDIITANSGSNDVSVLLGNGAGSFAAAVNFSSGGTTPSDVVCKDFNADTHIDIAVSNEGSNNFGILLGDGTGNFGVATVFAVGTTPKAIIANNFNTADVFLDVAVANSGSNNITVWFGNGAGSFSSSSNFSVSTTPLDLDSRDLNGDSKADIVAACNGTNRISVLLASGVSSFAAAANYTTGALPQSVILADFNNDGKYDAATANKVAAGVSGTVSVFMGSGTGTFGTKTDFTVSNNTIGITAGVIDAGTLTDLAVVNFDADNVSILLNTTAVVTASGATTFCDGSSVTLTSSSGVSYLWSPGSSTTPSILVTTSGNYHVTTSNLSGLCNSQSTDIVVTVNPEPSITSITGTDTICSSGSTTL
ncbi:MAG TPA: VCBS repeat-containing protein, partial [Flavobacteriales bacterium]|nr:VCBS repeat-containing protein [Flavobacteriales bacterium]